MLYVCVCRHRGFRASSEPSPRNSQWRKWHCSRVDPSAKSAWFAKNNKEPVQDVDDGCGCLGMGAASVPPANTPQPPSFPAPLPGGLCLICFFFFVFCSSPGGSYLGDVNVSAILDSFSVSYDKRVRPNYGGKSSFGKSLYILTPKIFFRVTFFFNLWFVFESVGAIVIIIIWWNVTSDRPSPVRLSLDICPAARDLEPRGGASCRGFICNNLGISIS